MRGIGRRRQIAALDLVLALGAGLDAPHPMRDREVDGAVVAGFEMQQGKVAGAAPIAAVERVLAAQVERAGDQAAVALAHDKDDALGHALADEIEERAGEVRRAPFAVRGRDVEAEEGIPMPLLRGGAGQGVDLDAAGKRGLGLSADGLSPARAERGEAIIEAGVAVIFPVELLAGALQETGGAEALPLPARRAGD